LCLSKIIEALSGGSFECQTPLKNRMKNNTVLGWNVHSLFSESRTIRDGPFNLKGERDGGYGFFSKKNILIPNVAEKNILILVEEKKNNLIQSFCHITQC
jgi:hypothetical protein